MTTSGHVPDESVDGVLEDLLLDLDRGINELLDKNKVPVADLPILVFFGKCQSSCSVLDWSQYCSGDVCGFLAMAWRSDIPSTPTLAANVPISGLLHRAPRPSCLGPDRVYAKRGAEKRGD
ncbi:unnamed protein product [Pleuronectes platessa]|uniref:Uncharacterized protein n=1 Tax=Pleuronectes platessa TaxID=8262 RepID=A0A9N7VRU9_PLEPL|nr:unnamed protein product [Pleuronectes platessa]